MTEHLSSNEMESYHDPEFPKDYSERIGGHLIKCRECREENPEPVEASCNMFPLVNYEKNKLKIFVAPGSYSDYTYW